MTVRRVITAPQHSAPTSDEILVWGALGVLKGQHKGLRRVQVSERPAGDHIWALVSFGRGAEVPLHVKPTESNYIFVVQGEIELLLEGAPSVRLRPFDCLLIQANTVHGWRTLSAEPAILNSVRFIDQTAAPGAE